MSLKKGSVNDQTIYEEVKYTWTEVKPSQIRELERESGSGERRRSRDILIAIDHSPKSKQAFDWALVNLCRVADTVHLVHAVPSVKNEDVNGAEATKALMEKLAVEALKVAMVKTEARIVEGDAGKAICKEAESLKPAAVVMGTRGRSLIRGALRGSVSQYCFRHCTAAPIIIVPATEAGEESISHSEK